MGGYFSVAGGTYAVGRGAAAVCAQQGGGPNDAADYVQTRGRSGGLFTPDEEKFDVAISSVLQAPFSNVIDGQAQYTDSGDHNSHPRLAKDLEANHPVQIPAADVGCLPRVGGFLVKQIRRVYSIVRGGCTVVMVHCTAADDQIEEQQKRCYEYSKKALAFEGCTLAAYFLSPVASSARRATLFVTMATLFLAMITDVISLKTKPKWGRALVYLSSFLQMMTTFLVFISLDKAYGYAFISVPVLIFVSIGIACFQHKQQLHGVDEADEDHLNRIFDFSALILNWGALITAILCYSMEATHSGASITGFLFIFTVILSLYLMMVTTLRDVALTLLAIYLDYSLAALLFGTLIATIISFITGNKT